MVPQEIIQGHCCRKIWDVGDVKVSSNAPSAQWDEMAELGRPLSDLRKD